MRAGFGGVPVQPRGRLDRSSAARAAPPHGRDWLLVESCADPSMLCAVVLGVFAPIVCHVMGREFMEAVNRAV